MMDKANMNKDLVVLFLVITVLQAVISLDVVGPVDTVVRRGTTGVILTCTDEGGNNYPAYWQKVNTRLETPQIYFYSRVDDVPNAQVIDDRFDVDTPDHYHDLIVKEAGYDTAGRYRCTILSTSRMFVEDVVLIVADELVCGSFGSDVVLNDGDSVDITCSVTLAGGFEPRLSWLHGNVNAEGTMVVTDLENGEQTFAYTSTVIVDSAAMNEEMFTCTLHFDQTSSDKQLSAPSYQDTCTTDIVVVHRVTRVMTSPSNDDVDMGGAIAMSRGDLITCSASARPLATFAWVKMGGNGPDRVESSSTGDNTAQMRITDEMAGAETTYRCIATNEIPGDASPASSSKQVTFNVVKSGGSTGESKEPTDKTGESGTPEVDSARMLTQVSIVTILAAFLTTIFL